MIRSMVVCTTEDSFYISHPIYSGPYQLKGNKDFKVGDLVYWSISERTWNKDHILGIKE